MNKELAYENAIEKVRQEKYSRVNRETFAKMVEENVTEMCLGCVKSRCTDSDARKGDRVTSKFGCGDAKVLHGFIKPGYIPTALIVSGVRYGSNDLRLSRYSSKVHGGFNTRGRGVQEAGKKLVMGMLEIGRENSVPPEFLISNLEQLYKNGYFERQSNVSGRIKERVDF